MPYPTTTTTTTTTLAPAPRRAVSATLAAAAVAAVLAAALPTGPALVALVAAMALGVVAATIGLRAQWAAATPQPAAPRQVLPAPQPVTVPQGELSEQLQTLRAGYVAKVNSALEAGRDDLAEELSGAYTEQALELLAGTGAPLEAPAAADGDRQPGAVRTLVRRFDRYTLEAFRPTTPYRHELVHSSSGR